VTAEEALYWLGQLAGNARVARNPDLERMATDCAAELGRLQLIIREQEGLPSIADDVSKHCREMEEELAQLRAYRDRNVQLSLDLGQMLGPEYDGVNLRDVVAKLMKERDEAHRRIADIMEALRANQAKLAGIDALFDTSVACRGFVPRADALDPGQSYVVHETQCAQCLRPLWLHAMQQLRALVPSVPEDWPPSTTGHPHVFTPIATHDHAPTGPEPEHTAFIVVGCGCGALTCFPQSNYDLTTAAFKESFEEWMRDHGYHWEGD
jgi:hypothetical protein